ncbi:Peptidoglycan/xylan/chitin deacetylase, PgdA/CDA1 family [Thermomonospora echinospora]|uniref:Peptidoglycan/xylan/chitin deacetylase, PgdA/CDA1 family n=1 Tax=Thermomonospora echinospora TaxID=1992 RepID=A0A1H6EC59_9ACTN|nr:polysaccharide deacetylase family protein [Thermomonospora echinospora]SEG94526.1 Peptidoglycan/xylan/chitin deacetylase, PgdA/CDA1 family [Thermomonospora echinospora]
MSRHQTPYRRSRQRYLAVVAFAGGLSLSLGVLAPAEPAQAKIAGPAAVALPAAQQAAAEKVVYLSFDDGPSSGYTPKILNILAKRGVRATFFVLGENVNRYPSLTLRAHERGHSIQNHTWSHPDLRQVSWKTFTSQVGRTDRVIRAQTGYTPRCLRPPYGSVDSKVRSRAGSLGKTVKLWTVDPRDWSRPGSSVIARRVLDNVRPGSIILLHDGGGDRSQTVAALPTILRTLKARGYTFRRMWC